jgi:hypothetical protein
MRPLRIVALIAALAGGLAVPAAHAAGPPSQVCDALIFVASEVGSAQSTLTGAGVTVPPPLPVSLPVPVPMPSVPQVQVGSQLLNVASAAGCSF